MRFITFVTKNLLRRKTRSILTALGIAVAVGTTIALLGISDGFKQSTLSSFEGRDVDLVVLEDGSVDQLSSDVAEAVMAEVNSMPGVKATAAGLVDLAAFPHEGTTVTALVQGWDPESFLQDALTFESGRALTTTDGQVAIVGSELARKMNKKIGDAYVIEGVPFEIVGIYDSVTPAEDAALAVPLRELQKIKFRDGRITGFSVVLDPAVPNRDGLAARVCQQIAEIKGPDGKSARLNAQPTKDYIDNSTHLKMAQGMAWLTSAIAIFVGTIGMLNTMIMSVVERVREISILRAIGWRKNRVIRMIIGESLLLSLAGAIVGSAGAVALTRFLSTLPVANGVIQGPIAIQIHAFGLIMALLVGVVGGLYPALRAAQLMPSEGLRHE
jgi:putative ABC transport system permease protein